MTFTAMLHLFKALPKGHKMLISGVSAALALLMLLPSEEALATRVQQPGQLQPGQRYSLPLQLPASTVVAAEPALAWQALTVQSGDSLARLFARKGLSAGQLQRLLSDLGNQAAPLTQLRPGEVLEFAIDSSGQLQGLRYAPSQTQLLHIHKGQQGFALQQHTKAIEHREQFAAGTITSNFWNAGLAAGLSPMVIDGIADILGYDIDFALELRKGDRFAVLYQQDYVDGRFINDGHILAVTFTNQGQTFSAVRHSDGNYYTPQGKSLRKAFLRSPVNYKYISSSFNPRRLHPVTGRVRPHNGIDYAARTGTPVYASGEGRVIRSAYSSLNGNHVFIKHGERFVTKYLHLSKRFVKTGQRVKQGQRIGNVGATGRVTGAHLHYEFLVNGVHRNPRTVQLPHAAPVPASALSAFQGQARELLARLSGRQRLMVAMQ